MRSTRILLVAVLLVAPAALVAATHNFGHRLYVVGQLVDADGYPIAETQIQGELEGIEPELNEGPCRQNPCPTQTDQHGHYGSRLYWHAHGVGESGTAMVHVLGETHETDYDTTHRFTALNAQLDQTVNHSASTWERFNRTYVVHGMLWVPGGAPPGQGTTWPSGSPPGCQPEHRVRNRCGPVNVNVTLELPDGTTLNRSTQTAAGYGIFRVTFQANQTIDAGTGSIHAVGESWSFDVDPVHQGTVAVWELPESGGLDDFPIVPLLGAGGIIAGGVGLYVGVQKWKSKRELDKAREESSRKRANE